MTQNRASVSKYQQQGAALLVALVLLFILSILGISSMQNATLEGQLASNATQKELTFQSAESATDIVLAIEDPANPKSVYSVVCETDVKQFDLPELSKQDVQKTSVTLSYGGRSVPVGWSLGSNVSGRRFVVTGESTLLGANTSTKISQGLIEIGAVAFGADC